MCLHILGWFILTCMVCWASLAIYYSNLPAVVRPIAAALFAIGSFGAFYFIRAHVFAISGFGAIFVVVLLWWLSIPPSNNRDWQPDVALLPSATIDGNMVTIHNIRNVDYRSESDYTVRHYDASFNLAQLRSVDNFLVYWGSPLIAHTMMSFGFDDGRYLCFSIETRKCIGQKYSAVKGFFKQYELTYVVADERDLVRLRTNYRHEDVYLFRLNASKEVMRSTLLEYLRVVNRLREQPEWYNALTNNCTPNLRGHTAPYNPRGKWDWRLVANGYVDRFMYEEGVLDRSLPLSDLKKRSYINGTANATGDASDFSRRIRAGVL
ncbi:Lnb N-terminal periplasmic domain-containing protein [Pelotalea chapellei]|uniref:DUF4105 domain-containing protein n=1 Tax=Pelotalea chapellei TaxID=44671 RepID=A0ABS5UCR9_9BACT|nr:DUF4105 domain-containing protein [Pelotalea chapellei]